ncbi:type II secretion system minor pseudopilin GspI [Stenotrophomonas sp. PD6]|uniref:type II secretion system minor pseudopilin GspI n=1 Tax=Stenotrophomonas sp. PD6 TaxID=3368612 RepID=UPI003BA214DF
MRRRAGGFTLIEVLIALAIVAVALAAVMRAVSVATDDQARIRDRRLALICVQNRWEELRLNAYPLQDARWTCEQGRSRFLGVQRIEQRNGERLVELAVYMEQQRDKRLIVVRNPWSTTQ